MRNVSELTTTMRGLPAHRIIDSLYYDSSVSATASKADKKIVGRRRNIGDPLCRDSGKTPCSRTLSGGRRYQSQRIEETISCDPSFPSLRRQQKK